MPESDQLLPPVDVIHERLTRNQRERRLLRTLLRLTIDADKAGRQTAQDPRQTAVGREVDHAS